MNDTIKAHLALTSVALIYGLNYIVAKGVMSAGLITSNGFIMIRVLAATVLLWLTHQLLYKEKFDRADLPYAALCALLGICLNQLCFFRGLQLTSPMHASLIMITVPMIVLAASLIVLKIKITIKQVIGVMLGLAGAGMLVSSAGSSDQLSSLEGDLFIFANATSYAFYIILVRKLMAKYQALTVLKWLFLLGTFMVIPFGMSDMVKADYAAFSQNHWYGILYVVAFTTYTAYLLNGFAISKVRPATVGFYIYFQPLIATVASIYLGQDSLDFIKVQSAILLFGGVYLVTTK